MFTGARHVAVWVFQHHDAFRVFPQRGRARAREPVTMPVAAPGRWVKGEAKSLLGGTRPRTPAPGESPRVAENAGTKVAEYRSTPPVARHDGDRRGSPWFSWRAIAVGCVLGALAVLAVLRAFPSVAAAVVPTPGPAVAAPREAGPSASLAVEPSRRPSRSRTSCARTTPSTSRTRRRRQDVAAPRVTRSSERTPTRTSALSVWGVSAHETDLREPTVGREDSAAVVIVVAVFATPTRARRNHASSESRDETHHGRHGASAAPRRAASVGSRSRAKRHEESSRAAKKTSARGSASRARERV